MLWREGKIQHHERLLWKDAKLEEISDEKRQRIHFHPPDSSLIENKIHKRRK